MNTVLDIKKADTNNAIVIYKDVNNIVALFDAVNDTLNINPSANKIRVLKNNWLSNNINYISNIIGFDCSSEADYYDFKFRGYYRWVYFKDGKPIYFDSSCCLTDQPSHKSTYRSKIYETLEFDKYEKVKL